MADRTLIYCADGNMKFVEIALRYGFKYGAQLPNTIYYPPYFVDQNWKNPDRSKYMGELYAYRPALATVLDWERPDQLEEVLDWADEAAEFVTEAVIIIPKVIDGINQIPRTLRGKQVRLGYSVPTKFAGTTVPQWEFMGWPVHLLGGSPHKQYELAQYLDVHSTDGNYVQAMAVKFNCFFSAGDHVGAKNRRFPMLSQSVYGHVTEDAPYLAFELSCMNIRALWKGCNALIRFAVDTDVAAVQAIAYQYRDELGRVMRPALQEAIRRRTLLVADMRGRIVGFCNYRARRDGVSVIYEIAVLPEFRRNRIGSGLFHAVPAPVRLKCTTDNAAANAFYLRQGMTLKQIDPGRLRPLNVYECE